MISSRGLIKELDGVVLSNKMQKTVVVQVSAHVKHPKYGKYLVQKSKFSVHDESSIASVGDLVRVRETRPLSKTKRWKLVSVLRKAPQDIAIVDVKAAKSPVAKPVVKKVVKKKVSAS